jgi:hypothetical protein
MHEFLKFILGMKLYMLGQFFCPSSGVFHCTNSNGMCHTGLRAGSGWNILILLASCLQIRSFSLYTQQRYTSYRFASRIRMFHPDPARKLSANLYDIYHYCAYSEKLLMMDRGTVRNM